MMQAYRGAFQTAYDHPGIIVCLSDHARSFADGPLAFFEERIRSGVVFRPDETVQVGFAVITLKQGKTENLEVWEPSFQSMPIEWVAGADNTTRFILVQKETCARIGASAEFPSILERAAIAKNFLAGKQGSAMDRDAPDRKDSGWVFRNLGEDSLEARYCSLFEVAIRRPSVIPYLALPLGASVTFSSTGVEMKSASKAASSENDLYLRDLHGSAASGWRSRPIPPLLPLSGRSV